MKLALLSDSHSNTENLDTAIASANTAGCEVLIHAGDLISPSCIENLLSFNGRVIFVFGNNDFEREEIKNKAEGTHIEIAGDFFDGETGGIHVYVTHYPQDAKRAFKTQKFDLVVFGHTHRPKSEVENERLLVNPGEIYGRRTGKSTWALFDTENRKLTFKEIGL